MVGFSYNVAKRFLAQIRDLYTRNEEEEVESASDLDATASQPSWKLTVKDTLKRWKSQLPQVGGACRYDDPPLIPLG